MSRRAWMAALASGAGGLAAAACSGSLGTTVTRTPEGRVLQWEGDEMLVLVSGLQDSYRAGETIRVNLLVNNQSTRLAQVRLRTRLLTRGDQAEVEAEVATLTVKAEDAANIDRELLLARSLPPGEYTLSVELPPWKLDGRDTGRGAQLRAPVQIQAA